MLRVSQWIAATAATSLAILCSPWALAQTTTNAVVTGNWKYAESSGYEEIGSFTCRGTPTCAGQISQSQREPGCSNYFSSNGDITVTNLNLAQSGSLQGTVTVRWNEGGQITRAPNGTCTRALGAIQTHIFPYTGNWNLATRTGTITVTGVNEDGSGSQLLDFKADIGAPPPVFPMTVTSTITATSASATAAIQFRPQDVGTSGSIYSFAVAPATLVKGGFDATATKVGLFRTEAKEDPPVCVLAQLSPSGQLIAVTAAQLQAYLSGTLSAQGASVTILNNASTPAVAGATFYVGYGTSSTAMINGGVYRSAITVPGAGVCPMLSSQTALWWNATESGWGLNLNHQGNILFGTLFTYDANRAPLWLVMSSGAMQSDGVTFTGDLYRTTGPAFNANPFTPIGAANLTRVGTMSVAFADVNTAALRYTVNGVEVSKTVERQVFGSRAAACFPSTESRASSTNYQDLWWNAAESGWGINITHQDNTLFATLFTYDATGRGLWLVMSAGLRQSDGSYLGELYQTAGPAFNANPFTGVSVATVGSMRLRFTDGNNGTLSYTYNGASVTKAITRQVFSSPVPGCS